MKRSCLPLTLSLLLPAGFIVDESDHWSQLIGRSVFQPSFTILPIRRVDGMEDSAGHEPATSILRTRDSQRLR